MRRLEELFWRSRGCGWCCCRWRGGRQWGHGLTFADDGDALDALVILEEPTFPGCLIRCRAIGMFRMRDENGLDDKVLCVASTDPRMSHFSDIGDVPEFDRLEIQHFFEVYKALEPGKEVEIGGWVGRAQAEKQIEICRLRLLESAE